MWSSKALKIIVAFVGVSACCAVAGVTNVQIRALSNHDYGIDTVATLVSDVLTAPDGLATYQIAFDVTPSAGQSIRSGMDGVAGSSTNWSWGVGPDDTLFKESDNDRVELIDSLRVTNFNSNEGVLTLDNFSNLSFVSVTIANGQSANKDSIELVVNGSATNLLGSLSDNPEAVDLLAAGSVASVTHFGLAAVSSANEINNKWSVNEVEVSVCITWRADWMRGAWGLSWAPEDLHNGRSETLVDDYEDFLDQISGLKTLDYIQLNLGMSYIYSPVHLAPHDLLESFWQGDVDEDGNPINLVVPRAASGVDPFGEWAAATKAAGLNVQVYVNSSQMLQRDEETPNPAVIPDITERWKNWCDTDPEAQAFINSQSYHTNGTDTNRPYMFCYAEFVLKEYSLRYGELIDAYVFDSGSFMSGNGDDAINGVAEDQRIYQAFADAARAGNSNVAVSYNNSPERDTEELNPFSEAVHAEDYMFGHPYNGGNNLGSHTLGDPPIYDRNYAHIEKMTETGGNVHEGELTHDWTWDDRVVGHFYPPMSTTAWNAGSTPALTDDEFLLWNLEAMQAGGAISWGAPLNWPNGSGVNLLINDWGIAQLILMDAHLCTNEHPGAPQWARQHTSLPDATIGQAYYHVLTEGIDFFDPEGDDIANVTLISASDGGPSWLTLEEQPGTPGSWQLTGIPTEASAVEYTIGLRVADASGESDRSVALTVGENADDFLPGQSGYPVWAANPLTISDATVYDAYAHTLIQGQDFTDYEDADLVVSKIDGADWLSLRGTSPGWWQLSGTPPQADVGMETLELSVSDGTHATACTLVLTVEPAVDSASIWAAENEDYGVDATATMFSDVITAYDGLATFQISIDVVPSAGTAIRSGDGGGSTTSQSWGIDSSGETSNSRYNFNGDSNDIVEEIGNIQIVNFNDGGGELKSSDIRDVSFRTVTVADAQSGNKDSVYFEVGAVTNDLGDLGSNPQIVDLETLSGVILPITEFSLGTSTTSTLNKWSINSIEVNYSILGPVTYSTWAYDHELSGSDALPDSDESDLDGYNNLAEFALGMNPANSDAGSKESVGTAFDGGTNYFEYVHNRRSDYLTQGLTYALFDSDDLVSPMSVGTNAQDQIFVGAEVEGYEPVTNRYRTDDPVKFLQLNIRQQ